MTDMEKKWNRCWGQGGARGSSAAGGADLRKVQDVSSSKSLPKSGSRRREPASSSSLSSKNADLQRPKQLVFDKKMARGRENRSNTSGRQLVEGNEEARLAAAAAAAGGKKRVAELGSVFIPGSKKQSLNHLLNFHYAPRHATSGNNSSASKHHRLLSIQKHKYNKEQFLQANCQFVVKQEGDYDVYMADPDALVDWACVEQVNIQVGEFPSCPICLYPPIAAKITRCGHVFCWSCILHYLALSDKTWRTCPICYEAVHKTDLKSVVTLPHAEFNIGETITLRLMKRARGTLTPIPAGQMDLRAESTILNMSDTLADTVYPKLLLADISETKAIIEREKRELHIQLEEDQNCPEKCFIEEAIGLLNEREINVAQRAVLGKQPSEDDGVSPPAVDLAEALEDLDIVGGEKQSQKYFFFYQAADGQNIYLHGLNVRMLEHTYGCLEHSPATITGRILEKESGSMTDELRNRLRYLQHLPVTCQLDVVELELKPPVIDEETVQAFRDQVETRKKRRHKKAKEEKKRERRIAVEEDRRMGKFPAMSISLQSHEQFPDFAPLMDTMPPLSKSFDDDNHPCINSGRSQVEESLSSGRSLPLAGQYAGPSFAKMLSSEPAANRKWPELAKSAPKLITVTGSPNRLRTRPLSDSSDAEQEEGYAPAPDYNASFSEAIALAFEEATEIKDQPGSSKGKKKNKKGKKLLFSTLMTSRI